MILVTMFSLFKIGESHILKIVMQSFNLKF